MHNVRLIALTKPVVDGLDTSEDVIIHNARVSNPDNQLNVETGGPLLSYCLRHHHYSIFEMANMVVEITTTRDISRQIIRHRSFSYQEFSGRYSKMPTDLILRETRMQDPKNKQSSLESHSDWDIKAFEGMQRDAWNASLRAYESALDLGVAKEQARAMLPEGLVQTRMYMNGTIRSWLHYCKVRCGLETQKEHRLIAKDVCKILMDNFPSLAPHLTRYLEPTYSAEI